MPIRNNVIFRLHESNLSLLVDIPTYSKEQTVEPELSYRLLYTSRTFNSIPVPDPKSFDYLFLATLDERGQGIPNDGDKRGRRKGYHCDQNYNLIEI